MKSGVKSKEFGCIWTTMFIHAMGYPVKPDRKTVLLYKRFYRSLVRTIPCKFCREFSVKVLEVKFPLDYSCREFLFKGLYIWKDQVNKKLISNGDSKTKKSPSLSTIKKKYNKLYATCDAKIGKCV